MIDANGTSVSSWSVPYGAKVFVADKDEVKTGVTLFGWDPYTDVILARTSGKVAFKDMVEGETYSEEAVEGGKKMIVITESKNRNLSPNIVIENDKDAANPGAKHIASQGKCNSSRWRKS